MIRKLIDVHGNNDDRLAINEESQMLLRQCHNSVYEVYGPGEPTFKILWRDDTGISEEHHKQYIDRFDAYFTEKIIEAVRQRATIINGEMSSSLLKCFDIISNANLQINNDAKLATGYEDICSALLDYVTDDNVTIPMMVYGPANSGKSIILSRTIVEVINMILHVINSYVTCQNICDFIK